MTLKRFKRDFESSVKYNYTKIWVFFAFAVLPALLILVPLVILPVIKTTLHIKRINRLNARVLVESMDLTREEYFHFTAFKAEEAYWRSFSEVANSDSIGLTIDLIDSTMNLILKGVLVRDCKITKFRMSFALSRFMGQDTLYRWLHPPFVMQNHWASIPKAPVRIIEAPKDTIEAMKRKYNEIPEQQGNVHFTLQFDRGLYITVMQSQLTTPKGWFPKLWYLITKSYDDARQTLVSLRKGVKLKHKMWIEMSISRQDAKAVYRAIPQNAGMALRLQPINVHTSK